MRALIEVLRHAGAAACLALAAASYFYLDGGAYVEVRPVNFAEKYAADSHAARAEAAGSGTRRPLIAREDRPLAASLDEFIRRETGGELRIVTGPDWSAFIQSVRAADEGHGLPAGWEGRSAHAGRGVFPLFFRPSEAPFDTLTGALRKRSTYLRLDGAAEPHLEVFSLAGRKPMLGGGRLQPAAFFYPAQGLSLAFLAAGTLLYALLPWRAAGPQVVQTTRWRVALGGIALLLVFGLFFALPFAITADTLGALGEYWFLTAWLWLLAGLVLIALYYVVHYAVYRILVLEDRIEIETLRGRDIFPLAQIASIQPADLRPPQWLIKASFLAVFLGGSAAARLGQLGRASLLASSDSMGVRLVANDGRSTYIWYTDPAGNTQLSNLDGLKAALARSGAKRIAEVIHIRAVLPPSR